MIFVAVGTQKIQFDRLIRAVDEAAIGDDVFMQTGACAYEPVHCGFKRYLSGDEFEKRIRECDVFITHGGVGAITTALRYGKPVIAAPRMAAFGEHVDDHQRQIVDAFAEKNYLLVYNNGDDMRMLTEQARTHRFDRFTEDGRLMKDTIKRYLLSLSK